MNALGVLAHLAADHPLREGMVGVARDTRETAILDGDDEAAGGRAVVRTDGQHAAFKGIMATAMFGWLVRLNPFKTPDTQRLAVLFGVVYFAQGMWYLPNQTITIVLKERGLSAGQVADFFLISTVPWLVKPLYGLISDFVPLFGRRRKSYFLVTSGLAALAGLLLASGSPISDGTIETLGVTLPIVGTVSFTLVAGVWLFTLMALGLAFTDVLVDAMMVENGRPRGLTGAFQSVQWACITVASVLVGVVGDRLAETRSLRAAFLLAACFPMISMLMGLLVVREPRTTFDREAFRETLGAIREALAHRDMWLVACFILFWTFSPSFGPAFLYYQTDTLGFSQQFIGTLGSLSAIAGIIGATIYAPISRRFPLKRIVNAVIGLGVVGTLAYLLYRGAASALVIDTVFGSVGMITQLALLDLAAKSCPKRVAALAEGGEVGRLSMRIEGGVRTVLLVEEEEVRVLLRPVQPVDEAVGLRLDHRRHLLAQDRRQLVPLPRLRRKLRNDGQHVRHHAPPSARAFTPRVAVACAHRSQWSARPTSSGPSMSNSPQPRRAKRRWGRMRASPSARAWSVGERRSHKSRSFSRSGKHAKSVSPRK